MTKSTIAIALALFSCVDATRVRGGLPVEEDSLLSEVWAAKAEAALYLNERELSMQTTSEISETTAATTTTTTDDDAGFVGDKDSVAIPIAQQASTSTSCENAAYSMVLEPPVPGVRPGRSRPHIVLGMGINEPPFTTLGEAKDGFPLSGFVYDVAMGLSEVCDIDIELAQASANTCFTSFGIGDRLVSGMGWHGCANFLPTPGQRLRQAEFTRGIVENRTPSGILTRLVDGQPLLNGNDDLQNIIIADVPGVVPNPDALQLATNTCTGRPFDTSNITFIISDIPAQSANDAALRAVLEGKADAAWINAVTPESLSCANVLNGTTASHDCTLWDGLGTTFAFIQTGIPSIALSGTTLAMSKKGSGLAKILNPCIDAFLQTKSYLDICLEYGLVQECYPNEFFPSIFPGPPLAYATPTNELSALNFTCADGYCPCPEESSTAEQRTP